MPAPWAGDVLRRASGLHRAGLVSYEALTSLLWALDDPMWHGAQPPFVSSTDGRGASAEFDAEGIRLDIEASPDGSLSVFAEAGGFDWEGPIGDLPGGLPEWARRICDQDMVR